MDRVTLKRMWSLTVVVGVSAAAVLASLPTLGLGERLGTVLLLALATFLAGARPVHIPSLRTEVTATHPFVFCTMAAAGPHAAGLVALIGVLGATAGEPKRRRGIHLAFNLGAVLLSTALAAWTFLLVGGVPGSSVLELLGPLTATAAAYFLVNTGLVALAIAIDKSQPLVETWWRSLGWTTVSYFTGLTLAVLMVVVLDSVGPWAVALGVPPCWFIAAFYRSNKERLEEHQRRMREIEELNADLERRVDERTRDLKDALGRIEELQELKKTLTETLIHDLKNPLTAVCGNLDLLEFQQEGRGLELVRRSKAGASRLLRMILDLLDVEALEDGSFTLHRDEIDIVELARAAVENAEAAAEKRGVSLAVDVPDHPYRVDADGSVLHRVLDNLLANALQHSRKGMTITVRVEPGDGQIGFSVADQGPGIPPEQRERVFEKYARLELRKAGVSANRGLGLTFCMMAVTAHGGTLRVEENPGGGALFRVTLPFAPEPQPEKTAAEPELVGA